MTRRNGAIFLHSAAGFVGEHQRNAARWDLEALVRELHDPLPSRSQAVRRISSNRAELFGVV